MFSIGCKPRTDSLCFCSLFIVFCLLCPLSVNYSIYDVMWVVGAETCPRCLPCCTNNTRSSEKITTFLVDFKENQNRKRDTLEKRFSVMMESAPAPAPAWDESMPNVLWSVKHDVVICRFLVLCMYKTVCSYLTSTLKTKTCFRIVSRWLRVYKRPIWLKFRCKIYLAVRWKF